MKRLMTHLSVGMLVLCSACGGSKTDDLDNVRKGLPSESSAHLNAPGNGGALVGDPAAWYGITKNATDAVNGGTVLVLGLLRAIVQNPPTSHPSGSVYVWGPSQPSGLEALSYRLTVTDQGNHVYTYNLDARGKSDPDTAFITILSGTHTAVADANGQNDEQHGSGNFILDWDKRKTLANAPTDKNGKPLQGTWDVTYDHKTADAAVDVAFANVLNDQGQAVNAAYHYAQPAGGDGRFQFASDGDVQNNGSQAEHFTIESRWHNDGSGRSDIKVTGGDVQAGQTGTASQCWDSGFKETFATYQVPVNGGPFTASEGAESGCGFSAAEYFSG